ncbi:hypothetical protein [Paracoccus benzoatiresistens]|uniref:Uncharacterized protein n=1 Tax=Paracoccus benzoatiresistens TaxID=2997341 RepID=A0ABT4J7G9_9RHOB|nr:hypothetical protein [Paracoccus sp. EF6]MCZ0962859.1 hypothetical protein [Paracoccus sp. EF6]
MADLKLIVGSHMRAMVGRLGCFDAVAETINARWGCHTVKGTISRKANGTLNWDVFDVVALEDALGCDPVSQALARRNIAAAVTGNNISPINDAAVISKENGEAIAALIQAGQSDCAGLRADAICQLEDAERAIRAAKARLMKAAK